jgi:hypothetical protein
LSGRGKKCGNPECPRWQGPSPAAFEHRRLERRGQSLVIAEQGRSHHTDSLSAVKFLVDVWQAASLPCRPQAIECVREAQSSLKSARGGQYALRLFRLARKSRSRSGHGRALFLLHIRSFTHPVYVCAVSVPCVRYPTDGATASAVACRNAVRRHPQFTTTPETPAPLPFCPECEKPLAYRTTVLNRMQPIERWDCFECRTCGAFEYHHRTRRVRAA